MSEFTEFERKDPSPPIIFPFTKSWAEMDDEEEDDPSIFQYDECSYCTLTKEVEEEGEAKKNAWTGSVRSSAKMGGRQQSAPTISTNAEERPSGVAWRPRLSGHKSPPQRGPRSTLPKKQKSPSPTNAWSKPLRDVISVQGLSTAADSPPRLWRPYEAVDAPETPEPNKNSNNSPTKPQLASPDLNAGLSPSDKGTPDRSTAGNNDVSKQLEFSRALSCDAIAEVLLATPLKVLADHDQNSSASTNHHVGEIMVTAPIPYTLRSSCSAAPFENHTKSNSPVLRHAPGRQGALDQSRHRRGVKCVEEILKANGGSMNLDILQKRCNWRDAYQPALGPFQTFVRSHREVFICENSRVSLVHPQEVPSALLDMDWVSEAVAALS